MSKGKLIAACVVWLMLIAFGAVVWKLVFKPARDASVAQQQAQAQATQQAQQQHRLEAAGSESRYKHTLNFYLDSFSGYAVLRSDVFQQELAKSSIRLHLHDDQANYPERLAALQRGDAQLAAFTIDALIKTSAQMDQVPGTIVALIDETAGADAALAYKQQVPNVDALNRPDTRLIFTRDSPSETLARVVMSRFSLESISEEAMVPLADIDQVVARYKASKPSDPAVYLLWEPYVSELLENPALHVVVDSSQFPSTIVDVIVASRDFLLKNPDVVRDVVRAYLTAVYHYRDRQDLLDLLTADARKTGAPLSAGAAEKLVEGIWWKNTQENLAHMGILPGRQVPYLEDMIENLVGVLRQTGGIDSDPTDGHANLWFYSKVLEGLKDFHPGLGDESVRDQSLPALTETQWQKLTSIGTAKVPTLVFARGTDRLTGHSKLVLDELAVQLNSTRFYVSILGNASRIGNLQQNKLLAERRAKVAQDYLIDKGVDKNRIRALGGQPSGSTSVTFKLGQLPY